jgi:hypothetical protein
MPAVRVHKTSWGWQQTQLLHYNQAVAGVQQNIVSLLKLAE